MMLACGWRQRIAALWCRVVGHRVERVERTVQRFGLRTRLIVEADCSRCGEWIVSMQQVPQSQLLSVADVHALSDQLTEVGCAEVYEHAANAGIVSGWRHHNHLRHVARVAKHVARN